MESRQRRESIRVGETSTTQLKTASAASSAPPSSSSPPEAFGRYVLHAPIARGGMATIYIARLLGAEGFSRLVAAKRLHPQFTEDPDFVTMFHDEARIASRIHHPNVVPVLDVVLQGHEVIIVQEYVHGVPLDKLFHAALEDEQGHIPLGIVSAIMCGVLAGLDAAHETRDEVGEPLSIVHRDVSPQNVMVSLEGVPRLLDFGIAKARSSAHVTREGFFKGKVAYMAPEQLRAEDVSRAADVYACGVMLWELLAHRRIHAGRGEAEMFHAVLSGAIPTLTAAFEDGDRAMMDDARWSALQRLEPIVTRALAMRPSQRFATAADMLRAVTEAAPPATPTEVAAWVKASGGEYLERRQTAIAASEESWRSHSRIAAAVSAMRSEESLARLAVAREMMPTEPLHDGRMPSTSSRLAPAPYTNPFASSPPPANLREFVRAHFPWVLAGGLLLVVGVLLGVLSSRSPSTETALATPPTTAPTAPVAAPPTATIEITPSTAVAASDPPLPAPPSPTHAPTSHASAAAPLAGRAPIPTRPTPAPHAAPQASHAVAAPPHTGAPPQASAPPPPAPPAAPSAKVDCDPPFYFEGTKKVFKPACL